MLLKGVGVLAGAAALVVLGVLGVARITVPTRQHGRRPYGLGDSTTPVFFDSDPLAIEQMSHDGLAFFPEPEDCELTPGELDEDTGRSNSRAAW